MTAYLIFEIEITDQAAWDHYRAVAGPVMEAAGGEFVLSSDRIEPLEGGWTPASLSVVAFPDAKAARSFYHSKEYARLAKLRQAASRGRGVLLNADPIEKQSTT